MALPIAFISLLVPVKTVGSSSRIVLEFETSLRDILTKSKSGAFSYGLLFGGSGACGRVTISRGRDPMEEDDEVDPETYDSSSSSEEEDPDDDELKSVDCSLVSRLGTDVNPSYDGGR